VEKMGWINLVRKEEELERVREERISLKTVNRKKTS
jgi:hypothetical protein